MDDEKINGFEERMKNRHAERNYNFFGSVGQIIDHVDTINFSMDKDGTFHFENIGQVNGVAPSHSSQELHEPDEERFCFTHPELDDEEAWRIHEAVKRLVAHQKIPEICNYLRELKQKGKVMLPSNAMSMYNELARLGMPRGEGFSDKHFKNNYMK